MIVMIVMNVGIKVLTVRLRTLPMSPIVALLSRPLSTADTKIIVGVVIHWKLVGAAFSPV